MRGKRLVPIVVLLMSMTASGIAAAQPSGPLNTISMNPRTTFAVVSLVPGVSASTPNAAEPRAALSIVKLYLVDYALRKGDGSAQDRELSQRAIQLSDDGAASALDAKYPQAIDAVAAEYRLASTRRGPFWGQSYTSAQDTAQFLVAKESSDIGSPILGWMATANPIAADGMAQNWGTVHIPAMFGTKWGWSDDRTSQVASASFGPGFATAAFTDGSPADENADLAPFSIR